MARRTTTGLRIDRRFTRPGVDPYSTIEWSRPRFAHHQPRRVGGVRHGGRRDPGLVVAGGGGHHGVEVLPQGRRAPAWTSRGIRSSTTEGNPVTGPETSARQVFDRLAGTWRRWGEENGYFASGDDAAAFEDEIKYMLANQIASPNSPQWFNTGLHDAYGLTGPAQGFWYIDPDTEEAVPSPDAYSRPAPHACFINAVTDDLVSPGGIMDLWLREARLFKFGSGTGSNFSSIRAENEPLIRWWEIVRGDVASSRSVIGRREPSSRAAPPGRAAKMVILDLDHPDIETFIDWKKIEEDKARVLIQHGGYPADFNGEAYATVSGQNSNNSVRVPNDFVRKVDRGRRLGARRADDGQGTQDDQGP